MKSYAVLLGISFFTCLFIEDIYAQGTKDKSGTPEVTAYKKQYSFPWAGGMNSCQFLATDMNHDGKKDILVFDRCGNRKMTFVNTGSPGIISYSYDPFFEPFFPEFSDWVVFQDYNQDGKEDIFTYSPGFAGIKVYRNISISVPEFELVVYPYLTSYQGGGNVNILVTYADYPGITDIDNDGDTDILTFWGLGSFVQLHLNQSMEKYGIPDSLDYIRTETCWGNFAEGLESNEIYLDTCNFNDDNNFLPGSLNRNTGKDRHTGSSFLVIDLDNDMDKDVILGDADFPDVIRLNNGGTPDNAVITGYDMFFPPQNPVRMFSMPVCFSVDLNNDLKNDLVVSPFDPSPDVSDNFKNTLLYINTGNNEIPDYTYTSDFFLQEDMLDFGSGAYPVICDINNDGLMDILVSNFGYYDSSWFPGGILTSSYTSSVALLKNKGTSTQPSFNLETIDFAELSKLQLSGIYPSFADLDKDNDVDMVTGNELGTILYFENIAEAGQLPEYAPPVNNYQNIDVGAFSTPQLIDIDRDNRTDMIIGEKGGNLNYYRNTGTIYEPVFTFITDSLGKVNVTNPNISYYGYSVPCFFEAETGKWELIAGSEQGKTFYFRNIEGNLEGEFEMSDSLAFLVFGKDSVIEKSYRTGCTILDFNSDGLFELVTGNFSGGLKYYTHSGSPNVQGTKKILIAAKDCFLFPNPVQRGQETGLLPAGDVFPVRVDMTDMSGRTVFSQTIYSGPIKISTDELLPGFYVCKFSFEDFSQSCNVYTKLVIRN